MMTSTREQHRTTSTREQQRWKAGWGVGRWVGGWWVGGCTIVPTRMQIENKRSGQVRDDDDETGEDAYKGTNETNYHQHGGTAARSLGPTHSRGGDPLRTVSAAGGGTQ